MRLPRYICPAWYNSVVSFFIIFFLFLSVVFAEDNASLEAESTEKIHITADTLVSDSNAKFAEFIGNVEAIQGEFIINSDKLKIFYKGDIKDKAASGTGDSIDKIIANGNVKIKSKDMSAVSPQAEYDTDTMIIVLSGENSKVYDQKNFVTGSKITFYRKEGKTRVEGDKSKRVTAVFYPKEKTTAAKEGEKGKGLKAQLPENASDATKEIKPEEPVFLPQKTGDIEKNKPALTEAVIKPAVEPEAKALMPAAPAVVHVPATDDKVEPLTAYEKKEGEKEKGLKAQLPENTSSAAKEIKPEEPIFLPQKTGDIEKDKPALTEAVIKLAVEPEVKVPIPAAPAVAHVPAADNKAKPLTASEKVVPGSLKKSMGVTIFEDKSVYGAKGFQETLSQNLTENIRKNCHDILFLKTGDNNYPSSFIKFPMLASGNIDTYKLCEAGRQLGLTTILAGSVTDIKADNEPRGQLFWKKTVPEISMTVRIELLDTETGTKLFNESYTYKKDSDKAGIELVKSGKIEPAFLKEALKYYTSSTGNIICNIMKEQKWRGFISSVSGDRVTISSGKNMGLASGKVFEVFGNSLINGIENQKFLIPGPKTGEVKITNVLENSSEAVTISGSALKEGYSIKPK